MQSSSKIPRLVSDEKGSVSLEMETKKDKQEATRKLSLTDQGKAAKLLRKRLAMSLATNTKIKSDSGTSASEASDQETVVKESKAREERKSSIPRKISQEKAKTSPAAKQLLEAISERIKTASTSERQRKFATVSLTNGVGNIGNKDNLTAGLQKQKETTGNSSFVTNINNVSNNNAAEKLSRELASCDETLPTIHEQTTRNSEDALSSNHYSFDLVESELVKLRVNLDKTLKDFVGINDAAQRVKMKLEELRKERVCCGTREVF